MQWNKVNKKIQMAQTYKVNLEEKWFMDLTKQNKQFAALLKQRKINRNSKENNKI